MAGETHVFGTLLRRYRANAGLTQEELAERAGLSVRGISDLERGTNQAPYRATVQRLIEALGLSNEEAKTLELATSRRRGPTSRTRESSLAKLPIQPTSLIGRERDEAQVIHLLRWEGRRMLTLTGPGGVGKTRLALQVAESMAHDFADGVVHVPLAAIRDAELVIPAIAAALSVREPKDRSSQEGLIGYLEDREVLLVLDNLEQVLDAGPALATVLSACPKVKMLLTSRVPLHLRGEQAVEVVPLDVPPSNGAYPLDNLLSYPSVALLIERARLVKPSFSLTVDNSAALAEICRRLDGLPLAIELAAARLRMLSPAALLIRLQHRLQVLAGGTQEVDARQQTMRNTIVWSYDLLSEQEQILFRRLSVFAGRFSLEEVEAVCATDQDRELDVFEVLTSLVEQSLVFVEEQQAHDPLFRMLETTGDFARECLEDGGEAGNMRERHSEYYVTLVERAEPELRGRDQEVWLARLDRDQDNVRVALHNTIQNEQIEKGLRIAAAQWWFWYVRGYLSEGRRWLEALLNSKQACDGVVTPVVQARALRGAGVLTTEQGDYPQAEAYIKQSLDLFRQLGDTQAEGTLLTILGNIAKYQTDYERAAALYSDALATFREAGDVRSISVALNNLGSVAKEQGDHAKALGFYEESLAAKRDLGDKRGIAIVLSNIGTMAHAQGDYPRAAEAGEESMLLLRDLGDKDLASALDTLARAVLAQGDSDRALGLYREGLTVSKLSGEKQLMAFCLEGVGRVAGARGHFERATLLYGAGIALRESIGAPLSPAERAQDSSYLDVARQHLGDSRYTIAWNQGQTMSVERAVACALDDSPAPI